MLNLSTPHHRPLSSPWIHEADGDKVLPAPVVPIVTKHGRLMTEETNAKCFPKRPVQSVSHVAQRHCSLCGVAWFPLCCARCSHHHNVFSRLSAAHTPDNSFLGFVVEQHLNASDIKHIDDIKRQNQSLVYGKVDNFWKVPWSLMHSHTSINKI